jgi:hypothetical protein
MKVKSRHWRDIGALIMWYVPWSVYLGVMRVEYGMAHAAVLAIVCAFAARYAWREIRGQIVSMLVDLEMDAGLISPEEEAAIKRAREEAR